MRTPRRAVVALALSFAPVSFADPLVTDRPDFTESPVSVAPGRVQLEAGFTYVRNDDDGVRTEDWSAPEALLRIGLIERLELRLNWDGYSWNSERPDGGAKTSSADAYDAALGFKYEIVREQDGLLPMLGVLGEVSFPTGNGSAGGEDWGASVTLAWTYDLHDRVSLAGNFNLASVPEGEQGERYLEPSASVALGFKLTEKFGAYVEYFGFFPDTSDADIEQYADTGLTYLVNDNLQFDVRVGFGLNEDADDFFAGAGFAVRF